MSHRLRRDEALTLDEALDGLADSPRRAAQLILQAAAQNDLDAQALLGQLLLDGHGIAKDRTLALRWFRIAAGRGHAMAANMAGRCLEHGWGCAADAGSAAEYYRMAADRGLDWGLYNLANLLATGRGVPDDPRRAFSLYLKAAQLGHAKSMNLVGRCLEDGLGTPANPQQAHDWYRRSAEAGDFRGQFSHATVLLSEGRWDEARHWLLQALECGHRKFLSKALEQLSAANLPPLQDIVSAYRARCAALPD